MTKNVKNVEVIYDNKVKNLQAVLLKKAMGYKIRETAQEYAVVDDELKLIKKKVNVKYFPPDLSAIEIVLQNQNSFDDFKEMTDEELEKEKQKLIKKLKLLKQIEKEVEVEKD